MRLADIAESKKSLSGGIEDLRQKIEHTFQQTAQVKTSILDSNTFIFQLIDREKRDSDWDEPLLLDIFPLFLKKELEKMLPGEKAKILLTRAEDALEGRLIFVKVKLSPL